VPLALVADQYFAYIAAMEAIDVEVAADYLVIASTLVFLKSKALLPPIPKEFEDGGEESAESVEQRLRERLIAYSRIATPAATCSARALEAASFYVRAPKAAIRRPNSPSATRSTSRSSRARSNRRCVRRSPKCARSCASASRSSNRWIWSRR
jgi:segregation and condensation protein A